jgi:hypothetical protein
LRNGRDAGPWQSRRGGQHTQGGATCVTAGPKGERSPRTRARRGDDRRCEGLKSPGGRTAKVACCHQDSRTCAAILQENPIPFPAGPRQGARPPGAGRPSPSPPTGRPGPAAWAGRSAPSAAPGTPRLRGWPRPACRAPPPPGRGARSPPPAPPPRRLGGCFFGRGASKSGTEGRAGVWRRVGGLGCGRCAKRGQGKGR